MIAYEIQLWYVIRDKTQSETKFSSRKKNLSRALSQISSAQSELPQTNQSYTNYL